LIVIAKNAIAVAEEKAETEITNINLCHIYREENFFIDLTVSD